MDSSSLERGNNMRATWSLFKKIGFRRGSIVFFRDYFVWLGIIYGVVQIYEGIINDSTPNVYMYSVLISLVIIILFFHFHKTNTLLSKTFHLKDNYQITIKIGDYLDNADLYTDASCVTGTNDQFDLTNYNKNSLLYNFICEFFNWENKDAEERIKLINNFQRKITNYSKEVGLNLATDNTETNKKIFKHGSIIDEKFIDKKLNTRSILFFANSSIIGEGEFGGNQRTPRVLKDIWGHLHHKNIRSKPLLIPLLGTGHSKDATPMTSVTSIIEQFFRISYPRIEEDLKYQQIVPHLIISIRPEEVINNSIDILALHKYIEAMNTRLEYAFTKSTLYRKNIEEVDFHIKP